MSPATESLTPEQLRLAAGYMDTTIEDRRAATALLPIQPDFDLSTPSRPDDSEQ